MGNGRDTLDDLELNDKFKECIAEEAEAELEVLVSTTMTMM